MMVLIGGDTGGLGHYLAGRHPGKIGWLLSPIKSGIPRDWMPYAVDNGKYASWENGELWEEDKFFATLDRLMLSPWKPMWIAVPDEVANKDETLRLWEQYEPRLRASYKRPLAFVAQDGMKPHDVPRSADVVFVGGTTNWKWRSVALFAASFPRVHVGRVNWYDKLEYCEAIGVESCDGTGFFREGQWGRQATQLRDFIEGKRYGDLQPQLL